MCLRVTGQNLSLTARSSKPCKRKFNCVFVSHWNKDVCLQGVNTEGLGQPFCGTSIRERLLQGRVGKGRGGRASPIEYRSVGRWE